MRLMQTVARSLPLLIEPAVLCPMELLDRPLATLAGGADPFRRQSTPVTSACAIVEPMPHAEGPVRRRHGAEPMFPWKRSSTLALLVGAAVVGLACLSPRLIPFNMDEFIHYQPLGCAAFPLSHAYSVYRGACGTRDLRLPLTSRFLPLRSHDYIGSLPVVPFYPFWRLIREPVAARVQGAVFLLLAAWLAARLVRVPFGLTLLAGAVYPVYSLAFIVDMGPVGISLLLLLCALLAGKRAVDVEDLGRSLFFASTAGLSIALGVFVKPVFLWSAPALGVFALWRSHETQLTLPSFLRRRAAAMVAFTACMALPLVVLMEARDVRGHPYYEQLLRAGPAPDVRTFHRIKRMDRYLVDGSYIVPKTLVLHPSLVDPAPLVLALTTLLGGFLASRGRRIEIALWCVMGLGAFGFMVATPGVQEPHHVAFPLFFLVLALAVALCDLWRRNRAVVAVLATVTVAYWASLLLRLPAAHFNPKANHDKDRLLELVREKGLDRRTVQVHSAWGTYYISHLFGHPQQIVLAIDEVVEQPGLLERVRAISAHEARSILILSTCGAWNFRTPASERILGPSSAQYRFGNWCAVEHAASLRLTLRSTLTPHPAQHPAS